VTATAVGGFAMQPEGDPNMRVMVLVKATRESEAGESEIEVRPLFEAEGFGVEFTPELRAQEERLREQVAHQAQAATR
jgi:hypothetical protein